MDKEKKARLEAHGWKVGSAEELLGLTTEDAADIESKLNQQRLKSKSRARGRD